MKKVVEKKGTLEANINFPYLKVKLTSTDPINSLKEINRLMRALKSIELNRELMELEDENFFWKFSNISDEVRNNKELMHFIKQASDAEESSRHNKISLENKQILDFENNTVNSTIELNEIKSRIDEISDGYEDAKYVVLHVLGSIEQEKKQAIADSIRQKMKHAEIKTLFTDKEDIGNTIVEALFFGNFEECS